VSLGEKKWVLGGAVLESGTGECHHHYSMGEEGRDWGP
jgi:hypothetical protein